MRTFAYAWVLLLGVVGWPSAYAQEDTPAQVLADLVTPTEQQDKRLAKDEVDALCGKIAKKLASVSFAECAGIPYLPPRFYSVNGLPILEAHYEAGEDQRQKKPIRVLFLGGIHGDEYSSVSVTYKWLNTLNIHHSGAFDWLFVPLVNPDGLLKARSTRTNANQIDLNRNFDVAEGVAEPVKHWQNSTTKRARYYPGESPLSEPESRVVHQLIDEYKPTV
ncbi:MAG: M14 family zinc carboxypeptidase, partial [Pontibacterium sp.]